MPRKRTDRTNERNAERSAVAVDVRPSSTEPRKKAVHIHGPFSETVGELIFELPLDNYDPAKVLAHLEYPDFISIAYPRPDKPPELLCTADLCAAVNLRSAKGRFENGWLTITFRKIRGNLSPGHARAGHAMQWPSAEADRQPVPIPVDIVAPEPAIIPAHLETDTRLMVEDDRIIEKNGTRYFPLSLAAQLGQVARTTLVDWIKAKTAVKGRPLTVYNSATAHKSFLAEESVKRIAERFIKWREAAPAGAAGAITIGETKDNSGYIGIAKAAQKIGVDYHTLWLWATQPAKSSPTEEPLDVIRCTASEQFYIRESDIARLKKIVPKTGLRRGPRPQSALKL